MSGIGEERYVITPLTLSYTSFPSIHRLTSKVGEEEKVGKDLDGKARGLRRERATRIDETIDPTKNHSPARPRTNLAVAMSPSLYLKRFTYR